MRPVSSCARGACVAWLLASCAAPAANVGPAATPSPRTGADRGGDAPAAHEASAGSTPPRAGSAQLTMLPLGTVTLTGDVRALHDKRPVRLKLQGETLPALRTRLLASHPEARFEAQDVTIGPGALPLAVLERHRAPSFLVDADQPAVLELAQQLAPGRDLAALRTRVGAQLSEKRYGTFWTASRAAKNRAGDCSEHAVLVAALARAAGMPARVVVGYVLHSDGERGYAFGHAWSEVYDGTAWQRIDATPVGSGELDVLYVILSEIEDEGAAFVQSLGSLVSLLTRSQIEVIADGDATSAR